MLGYMAVGLAAVVGLGPAALAQDSQVLNHCKSAGPGIEADEGQTTEKPVSNTGVSVAVPIGRVCVGPESVDGEPAYVRRLTVSKGMTVVEVSTTPFMPEGPPAAGQLIARPDQPAGW